MQVAALLQGSDHVIQDKQQELSPAEQRALRAMDIEEVRNYYLMLAKLRPYMTKHSSK